jgi:hypothetical protein
MVHDCLALWLGLALFYSRATMTNLFFEAAAVVIAVVLAAATLILAAITDWFAALNAGTKSVHRSTFCLAAGTALTLAGVLLAYYPIVYMEWLVVFASSARVRIQHCGVWLCVQGKALPTGAVCDVFVWNRLGPLLRNDPRPIQRSGRSFCNRSAWRVSVLKDPRWQTL